VKHFVGVAALPKCGIRFASRGKRLSGPAPIADWDLSVATQRRLLAQTPENSAANPKCAEPSRKRDRAEERSPMRKL
jgi:hypothetical protein